MTRAPYWACALLAVIALSASQIRQANGLDSIGSALGTEGRNRAASALPFEAPPPQSGRSQRAVALALGDRSERHVAAHQASGFANVVESDGSTRPKSAIDMLANLRTALLKNLLLDRSFLAQSGILVCAGGKSVLWRKNPDREQAGYVLGFDDVVPRLPGERQDLDTVNYTFAWQQANNGAVHAFVSVNFHHDNPAVSFEAIEVLFGTDSVSAPLNPPPAGMLAEKTTSPHGYERVRYDGVTDKARFAITLEFSSSGTVNVAQCEEWSK